MMGNSRHIMPWFHRTKSIFYRRGTSLLFVSKSFGGFFSEALGQREEEIEQFEGGMAIWH
jgi:hypothetical protein